MRGLSAVVADAPDDGDGAGAGDDDGAVVADAADGVGAAVGDDVAMGEADGVAMDAGRGAGVAFAVGVDVRSYLMPWSRQILKNVPMLMRLIVLHCLYFRREQLSVAPG